MPANSGMRNGLVKPTKPTSSVQTSSLRTRGGTSPVIIPTSKKGGSSSVTNPTQKRSK